LSTEFSWLSGSLLRQVGFLIVYLGKKALCLLDKVTTIDYSSLLALWPGFGPFSRFIGLDNVENLRSRLGYSTVAPVETGKKLGWFNRPHIVPYIFS
jgi:hypothetical protein